MQVGQELQHNSAAITANRFKPSVETDNRADKNQRTVHFEKDRIVIMRRIHGVSMRVTMPVNKYVGIGVLLPNAAQPLPSFKVILVHADPDLSVGLFENSNPLLIDAAIAEWAQFLELPVLDGRQGETPAAGNQQDEAKPSIVTRELPNSGNSHTARRRGGTLAKRRPRFYARRQTGELNRMDQVHNGEREIIARH